MRWSTPASAMSESVAPRAHVKGGPSLSAILPGLGQLLAGRWGVGTMALAVWLGFVWVVVARRHVVLEAIGGAWGDRLAVSTLAAGLLVAWSWSWRDVKPRGERKLAEVGQWHLAVRAFSKNGTAVAGLIGVVGMYLVALIAPLITPADPLAQNLPMAFQDLSGAHPLGTDQYGRDVFARVLYGARISLTIGQRRPV